MRSREALTFECGIYFRVYSIYTHDITSFVATWREKLSPFSYFLDKKKKTSSSSKALGRSDEAAENFRQLETGSILRRVSPAKLRTAESHPLSP